jgi:hypothetical protein
MNKLSPEHLHLLLDEPIYVLHSDLREHLESVEEPPELLEENEQLPDFRGDNKKGILIIIDNRPENSVAVEDEEFLFKGLNALNIFTEDVAIIEMLPEQEFPKIEHHKRIVFSANPDTKSLYQLESIDNISLLQCHRISQIRNDKDLKVRFWLGLKAMFES